MRLQPLMGNLTGCDARRIFWTLELKTRCGRNPRSPRISDLQQESGDSVVLEVMVTALCMPVLEFSRESAVIRRVGLYHRI